MMSLSTIRHLSNEAAKQARREKRVPLALAEPEDVDNLGKPGHRIPNLGDYRPKGWKLVDEWLCDKTGVGLEWEPALTLKQLREKMKEKIAETKAHGVSEDLIYGYGTIEEGQFQMVLGVFVKEVKRGSRRKPARDA